MCAGSELSDQRAVGPLQMHHAPTPPSPSSVLRLLCPPLPPSAPLPFSASVAMQGSSTNPRASCAFQALKARLCVMDPYDFLLLRFCWCLEVRCPFVFRRVTESKTNKNISNQIAHYMHINVL
uniref:Uncharacterized protein n=1 Tax=Knipowitschia caucasica TaxID=637954 RepID=A0AAV2L7H8_KNICA